MKNKLFISAVLLITGVSCTKASVETYSMDGSWTFKNASPYTGLVEQKLILNKGLYQKTIKENNGSSFEEGKYLISQNAGAVEISFEGDTSYIYTGKATATELMIEKINGVQLNPPILYRKD